MAGRGEFLAMESVLLIAPVTALEFLGESYLLVGTGPILSVYDLQNPTKVCTSLNVLHNYRIHGIRHRQVDDPARSRDSAQDDFAWDKGVELAVFGGKGVRLITLNDEGCSLQRVGPLLELQDWALDVRWLRGEDRPLLGVSLAHNAVLLMETVSGNMVSLRSCEEACLLYSALLIGPCWETSVLVGGTVFNQLVLWRPGGAKLDERSQVERRLLGHSGVIFNICYLGQSGWLASASDDRSVRMWDVGVLGGDGGCGTESPTCLRVLYGHQARVFCVRLAHGRVFSAGEDGACLLWGWGGEGRVGRRFRGHRAGGVRALAVSEGGAGSGGWVATGGADGGVRLWKVGEGREGGMDEGESQVDLGFQGRGCPKVVRLVGGCEGGPGSSVVVCTDQGGVHSLQGGTWELLWQGGAEFQSYCVMEVHFIQGGGTCLDLWLCAVANLTGGVQVFPLLQPSAGIFLSAGQGKVHSLQWVLGRTAGQPASYLLASGSEGCVYRWRVRVEVSGPDMVVKVDLLRPFLLPPCGKRWLMAAVCLPHQERALWVCGDRRGSLLLYREQMSGERGEDDGEVKAPLQPVSSLFGVHGKQGVTCVCERHGVCYSVGRDGCVRVVSVSSSALSVRRVQRACKGMEWLEKVLFLDRTGPEPHEDHQGNTEEAGEEGSDGEDQKMTDGAGEGEEDSLKDEGSEDEERREGEREGGREEGRNQECLKEARIVLAGFHSVQFVLWDAQRQEKLLSVPCGGGHRSWAYTPPPDPQHHPHTPPPAPSWDLGAGTLVFLKQGSVVASRSLAAPAAGASGHALREGLHGRGLGCVCRLGCVRRLGNGAGERSELWEVLVTGGEDTTVTVNAVEPRSGAVRVLAVITDHISSVRALAALTRPSDGQRAALSCLLFSAGGRAQLQCYRLLIGYDEKLGQPVCQVTQVAGHRLDEWWERKRNRHKIVKMDPETRYMSMAVVHDGTDEVLLSLACSDGAVRMFCVNEVTRRINLLWESFYHQRCVLSVAPCRLEDPQGNRSLMLFSAATDGRVCLWGLTSVLDAEDPHTWQGPQAPCFDVPVHQSGVNTLAVSEHQGAGQQNERIVSVASGGDDGQLSVLVIKMQFPQLEDGSSDSSVSVQLLSHWTVPLAHSAPLTALCMLNPSMLVSTSPDQRVCVWSVCSTGLHQQGAMFSHTADAAGLGVWSGEGPEGGAWVMVCGQGLQVMRLSDEKQE